jgi:hypothetical protein
MKILIVIMSVLVGLSLLGCTSVPARTGTFNFIYRYGVSPQPKNELDTFKNTFVKDMVTAPSVTAKMYLTQEEMDKIHQKMLDIDIFGYPDTFITTVSPSSTITTIVTPYNTYYFSIKDGSRTKELLWDDEIQNPNDQASQLRSLNQVIQGIITSKDEYKKLPTPTSAYQ